SQPAGTHTLSLHDALPICAHPARGPGVDLRGGHLPARLVDTERGPVVSGGLDRLPNDRVRRALVLLDTDAELGERDPAAVVRRRDLQAGRHLAVVVERRAAAGGLVVQ